MQVGGVSVRAFAILGAGVAFALAACALHHPVDVQPDYPPEPPFGCPRRVDDAGFDTTISQCVLDRLHEGVRGFDNDGGAR